MILLRSLFLIFILISSLWSSWSTGLGIGIEGHDPKLWSPGHILPEAGVNLTWHYRKLFAIETSQFFAYRSAQGILTGGQEGTVNSFGWSTALGINSHWIVSRDFIYGIGSGFLYQGLKIKMTNNRTKMEEAASGYGKFFWLSTRSQYRTSWRDRLIYIGPEFRWAWGKIDWNALEDPLSRDGWNIRIRFDYVY